MRWHAARAPLAAEVASVGVAEESRINARRLIGVDVTGRSAAV